MQEKILNNRYKLAAQTGQGGMGTVYRAYDTALQRQVAVKVLNETGLDSVGQSQLLGEARAAAQLDHPNIVTVYDVSEADGVPFLVMQWVDGANLFDRPPETLFETLQIIQQICAALDHAHLHGIIHRDLKPENVIVSPDGDARLTDFGLARSTSQLTETDGLVGTVAYMAPEQALGQPVDGKADLYSLGVLLYELTTGNLPFQTDDPFAMITQHLYAPVVPPRAKNEAIPPALNTLILALLAKQPGDRPANAAAVGAELETIIEVLEPGLEPITPVTRELPTSTPTPTPTPTTFLDRIVRGQLVGRKDELALLRENWERVRAGSGQLVLLSGEPGIGKTRLVQEMATQVQVQGGRALMGASYPEQPIPFGPFAQQVLEVFRKDTPESLELSAFTLSELVRLAPPLREQFPDLPPNPELDTPRAAQYRMFAGVVTFCRALASQGPLLLVLEDLHWAEEGTLALLLHLARATRELPVFLVATYRETDLEDHLPLQNALRELDRARLGQQLKLRRLDREGTAALLAALFEEAITPNLLDGIYRETEGVPFFVEEVCKTLVESGQVYYAHGRWQRPADMAELVIPQSIQVALQRRIARLTPEAGDYLSAAAVLGRVFDFELLTAVSGAAEDTIIAALEAGEKAQLIRETSTAYGGTFEFTHALIPGTLVGGLSGLRRRRWHQKAGEQLAALRPGMIVPIAHHYWQAGNPAGVHYLKQAGDQAAAQYANTDAVNWYSRALEMTPESKWEQRFALLAEREKVYDFLGSRTAQAADLDQLTHLAAGLGAVAQARVALRQAHIAVVTSDYTQGVIHAQTAIEKAAQGDAPELAALAHWHWGNALFRQGQKPAAQSQYQTGLQLANEAGDQRQSANCLHGLGNIANDQGDYTTAKAYYLQALAVFREIGAREREASSLNNLGIMAARMGDNAAAREYYHQALAISKEIGNRYGEPISYQRIGNLAYFQQRDTAAAQEYYDQALTISREMGDRFWEGLNLTLLGTVAWYQGNNARASGYILQALEIYQDIGAREWIGNSLFNLGVIAANQEDFTTAQKRLTEAQEIFDEIGSQNGYNLRELGALALRQNDLPLAEKCLQQALEIHEQRDERTNLVEDWAALAKFQLAKGHLENARKYVGQVQAALEENPRLAGTIHPLRTFHFTWATLIGLGEDAEADEVLVLAAALIQDYLDKNPGTAAQEMFLRQPHHAVLWQAWREQNARR